MSYYYKSLSLSAPSPTSYSCTYYPSDTVYTPVGGHFHHYLYRYAYPLLAFESRGGSI